MTALNAPALGALIVPSAAEVGGTVAAVSTFLMTAMGVLEITAGIYGLKNCARQDKMVNCMLLGCGILVLGMIEVLRIFMGEGSIRQMFLAVAGRMLFAAVYVFEAWRIFDHNDMDLEAERVYEAAA